MVKSRTADREIDDIMTVPRFDDPLSEAGFQDWANWALSQADRIDPSSLAASGRFKWRIEADQERLILGASVAVAMASSDVGRSPQVIAAH